MNTNPLLDEIRRVRDEQAREQGYDVHRLFEALRAETKIHKAQGCIVSYSQSQLDAKSITVEEDSH